MGKEWSRKERTGSRFLTAFVLHTSLCTLVLFASTLHPLMSHRVQKVQTQPIVALLSLSFSQSLFSLLPSARRLSRFCFPCPRHLGNSHPLSLCCWFSNYYRTWSSRFCKTLSLPNFFLSFFFVLKERKILHSSGEVDVTSQKKFTQQGELCACNPEVSFCVHVFIARMLHHPLFFLPSCLEQYSHSFCFSIFSHFSRLFLQKTRVSLSLYENTDMRIEGRIIVLSLSFLCLCFPLAPSLTVDFPFFFCFVQGFDEYMNLVLDDAEEISVKKDTRSRVGL